MDIKEASRLPLDKIKLSDEAMKFFEDSAEALVRMMD